MAILGLGMAAAAQASPLNLVESLPLVKADYIDVPTYNASGGSAAGNGLFSFGTSPATLTYTTPDLSFNNTSIGQGTFQLDAEIVSAAGATNGALVPGTLNFLEVRGDQGAGTETMLFSRTLTAFGYQSWSEGGGLYESLFEFVFTQSQPDDGTLADWTPMVPVGSSIGVLVCFVSPFNADVANPFESDFVANSYTGFAKAFPVLLTNQIVPLGVPEPGTAALMSDMGIVGLFALTFRRRRGAREGPSFVKRASLSVARRGRCQRGGKTDRDRDTS